MACGSDVLSGQQHLVVTSTTVLYAWYTGWILCAGMKGARMVLKNKAVTGNFQSQPCIQLAAVRADNPGGASTKGALTTGAGEACTGALDLTSDTGDMFLIRFGVAYSLSSGSTAGQADVGLDVAYDQCGSLLGAYTLSLTTTTTTDAFTVLTGWVPATQASKIMAALVARSVTGNFQYRLCYRTAATSKDDPGAWSTTLHSWQGAGESNTGELGLTLTGVMWVQIGIQYSLSSGSTLGQATISAAIAAIK